MAIKLNSAFIPQRSLHISILFTCFNQYKILCDVRLCVHCALLLLLNFNWNILNKFARCTLFNDCAINKFNYWFMWFTLLNTIILLKSQARHTHNGCAFASVLWDRHLTTTDQAIWHGYRGARAHLFQPCTSNDGIEYIHMTTLSALAGVKCGFRLHMYWFTIFPHFITEKSLRMHSNRISTPHIINLFSGHTIYFCALPIYFTLNLFTLLLPLLSVLLFLSLKKIQSKTAALHRSNLLAITTAH